MDMNQSPPFRGGLIVDHEIGLRKESLKQSSIPSSLADSLA